MPEKESYGRLHSQWQEKALGMPVEEDPRLDSDHLRPVLNYDRDIVEVRSSGSERPRLLVGGGWQLIGSLVDLIEHRATVYLLVGRRSLYYRGGLWDNRLDASASFDEFFLLMRAGGRTKVVGNQRIDPTTSQILLGMRVMPDNSGLEVIQNAPDGYPKVIFTHQF